MARKLFHPCDSSAKRNSARHKEFSKPVFDREALRLIGRAFDKGIIKAKS